MIKNWNRINNITVERNERELKDYCAWKWKDETNSKYHTCTHTHTPMTCRPNPIKGALWPRCDSSTPGLPVEEVGCVIWVFSEGWEPKVDAEGPSFRPSVWLDVQWFSIWMSRGSTGCTACCIKRLLAALWHFIGSHKGAQPFCTI